MLYIREPNINPVCQAAYLNHMRNPILHSFKLFHVTYIERNPPFSGINYPTGSERRAHPAAQATES
jgi:hypothetical protein